MNIRGLFKTSLIDYPGKICSVIFTGGCNLRCGYCHNPELAMNSSDLEKFEDEEIFSFIEKRKGLIDGITVTGGEPAIDSGLIPFLERVNSMGLHVKLDTNGFLPHVISECIEKGLVDYVAVDVKTSPEKYPLLTGRDFSFNEIVTTLDILKKSLIDYEIRTTCVPGFVTVNDIIKIGESTGRVKKYYLQQFVNINTLLDDRLKQLKPYTSEYLNLLKNETEKFTDFCFIRGI